MKRSTTSSSFIGKVILLSTVLWLAFWSYSLLDGNITLISFAPYTSLQALLWSWAQSDWWRVLGWAVALSPWSGWYFLARPQHGSKVYLVLLAVVALILTFSANALSHDIFNYIFNAKMITVYQANPHESVALDFATDPWLRFMHNVHTPAPYGYGWTLFSLFPYVLSFGKFVVAFFSMKLWMLVGYVWLIWAVWQWLAEEWVQPREVWKRWWWLAAHPLLLIETLMNGHNDVWMMAPAITGLWLVKREAHSSKERWRNLALGWVFWAASVSTKFVTILLLPWMIWWSAPQLGCLLWEWCARVRPTQKLLSFIDHYWASSISLALLIPLLTSRSQQFHPWYAIWFLSFIPFLRVSWLRYALIGLSFSSLWRYLPWLWNDLQYNPTVQWHMRLITWSGLVVGLGVWSMVRLTRARK